MQNCIATQHTCPLDDICTCYATKLLKSLFFDYHLRFFTICVNTSNYSTF